LIEALQSNGVQQGGRSLVLHPDQHKIAISRKRHPVLNVGETGAKYAPRTDCRCSGLRPHPSEHQFVGCDERAESGQRHKAHEGRQAKRSNDEWPESRASRWIAQPSYFFFYRAASMLKAPGPAAARGRVSRMFFFLGFLSRGVRGILGEHLA
jgi:hypothetical protein